MAIQKTKIYILRKIPFRETSWILTCLTESFGKIKGIVKGARKEKSKWLANCELFSHSNMVFFEKTRSSLQLVTELSLLESHEKLRSNFTALTYAGYFAELLDQLLEEHDPQPAIYELLNEVIPLLEKKEPPFEMIARTFEIKLLEELGLIPHFLDCVECGSELMGSVYFSPRSGGVFCRVCHAKSGLSGFLISNGCLQAIRFLSNQDIQKASQLKLGKQIQSEFEQVTKRFIEHRLDKQLRSLHFMHQVKSVIRR